MHTPLCSVIIISYNNDSDLPNCLDAVTVQTYPNYEVIVVDNASTDKTSTIVDAYRQQCVADENGPRVSQVTLTENRGFAGGNNAGAAQADGEILVFLNPDTVAHPEWLSELVKPLVQDGNNNQESQADQAMPVGLTTSCILMADSPTRINTCGNAITWTGLTFCRGLNQPKQKWTDGSTVAAVSGAAFAVQASLYAELNGFDENFFMYFEDTDLSMRAYLAGYSIEYVPTSEVLHDYIFKFSPQKIFYQERNRWLTMFKVLRLPTLLLLAPSLMVGEAIAWAYALLNGKEHLLAKARGWQWLWQNRKQVQAMRKETQIARRRSDRLLLQTWSARMSFSGTVPDALVAPLENLFALPLGLYGQVCRRIVVW